MSTLPLPKSRSHNQTGLLTLNLLLVACTLWLLTVANTSITDIAPDGFGFVLQLPPYYWVGFACAIVSAVLLLSKRAEQHQYLEATVIVVLILYAFATPQLIYENVRIRDVYGVIQGTKQAVVDGHIYIGVGRGTGRMAVFPVSTIAAYISTEILGISLEALARWYPVYLLLTLALLAWCMARQIGARTIITMLSTIAFAWTQEYNLAPQSYALILYAALWVVLLRIYAVAKPRREVSSELLVIVFVSTIVATHIGTPVFLLFNLLFVVGILVGSRVVPELRDQFATRQRILAVVVLTTVVWLTWLAYVAEPSFQSVVRLIRDAVQETVRGNLTPIPDFPGPSSPEPHFAFVNRIRILLALVQVTLGLFSITVLWTQGRKWLAGLVGAWFVSCFASLPISMASYAQLYLARPLFMSLIPFAPLVGAYFNSEDTLYSPVTRRTRTTKKMRQIGIIAILVASIVLLPLTRYCADAGEHFSSSTLAARTFTSRHRIPAGVARPPGTPTRIVLRLEGNDYDYLRLWGREREYVEWIQQEVEPIYAVIYDSGESQILIHK